MEVHGRQHMPCVLCYTKYRVISMDILKQAEIEGDKLFTADLTPGLRRSYAKAQWPTVIGLATLAVTPLRAESR